MNKIQHQLVLENDAVSRLSLLAEIFLHRLINAVDRYGCFDARPMMLRAKLFPLKLNDVTEEGITTWLTECVDGGLIKLYEVNGMPYLQLTGFKRRLGAYKTPYPEPPSFEEEIEEPVVTEVTPMENAVQETPVYTEPAPIPESKPEPGKEHEHFLSELFKRENEKYLNRLAILIRQPEVKRSWVKAFNEHIRSEGNRYTEDHKWLDRLRVWLPENVQRLVKEEGRTGKHVMPRAMVF